MSAEGESPAAMDARNEGGRLGEVRGKEDEATEEYHPQEILQEPWEEQHSEQRDKRLQQREEIKRPQQWVVEEEGQR